MAPLDASPNKFQQRPSSASTIRENLFADPTDGAYSAPPDTLAGGERADCPPPSTQPCIPPGLLNRVTASAGVRAVLSPLPGGR